MTKITQIEDRGATLAWSPVSSHPDVVALGAKDSGGIVFEDTGGELELFDLNITSGSGGAPTLLSSVKTKSRFASVCWSPGGSISDRFKMGLLAGGMVDGTVHVWNPSAMIQKQESLITSMTKHGSGPVKAMQFSPLNPTKLATGGSNGQVYITDFENPQNPIVRTPSDDYRQHGEITAISWNTQVEHIVASASGDGSVAVLDLNTGKAWCELRCETSGQPVADVCWNPSQGLHLLTASQDDRNPLLKLWDLRSSTSMPLATLAGHTMGILKTSWSPHDETLLLSVGKDNRTILWDLYTLSPIADVPNDSPQDNVGAHDTGVGASSHELFGQGGLASSQQRRYDVQWSPINRGIATTCSLDRKVQVHSVISLATKCGRPPKWMKPSCSVSCGFGGAVVSCGAADKFVRFQTVVEQPELVEASTKFESELESTTVVDFCKIMAAKTKDPNETQMWGFMKVIFETNARQELLQHLGFDAEKIAKAAMEYTEDPANGMASMSLEDKHGGMTKSAENVIKEALLVGNFEAAVECCFRTGNLADALILASCGGADLWSKTQERFFSSQSRKRPFLSTVSAIIRNQMEEVVACCDGTRWQETLAILSTYAQSEEFPKLCIALGDRLESSGDHQSASLCYMCSLSLGHSVKFWRSKIEEANKKKGSLDILALHKFVVKVSVFLKASGSSDPLDEDIADLFFQYSQALAEQGLFVTASKYCRGYSEESKVLKDRLYRSRASGQCLQMMGSAPEFPFSMDNVKASRVAASRRAESQQQANSKQQSYSQNQTATQQAGAVQPQSSSVTADSDQLPPGWMALQDPSSGRTYYANQTTGETTWDKPIADPAPQVVSQLANNHSTSQMSHQNSFNSTEASNSTNAKLASKYGDGFVSSASHPELAYQYGNVGTSNPYTGVSRPGTASVASQEKAPVSATFNLDSLELPSEYHHMRDVLLWAHSSLEASPLSVADKRQLEEGKKGIAIFLKRLTRGDISPDVAYKVGTMTTALTQRDYATTASIQTDLVNNEWKSHKDWLKGVKFLIQLASKKL